MNDKAPLESDHRAQHDALLEAIRRAGSQTALARALGITQAAVSRWVVRQMILPAEHVLAVELATGISRHALRPDIYPIDDRAPRGEAA